MSEVRSGGTAVKGCTLAWEEAGSGRPVLLIHGTAASIWGPTFGEIARGHRAIHYDRRSYGKSVHPPLADLSVHAEDAAALLRERGARDAVLVGWSIGGVIALEVAMRHPGLVGRLVLLEPPLWAKKHPDLSLANGVVGSILLGFVAGPAAGGRRFSRWVFTTRDGGNSLDAVSPEVAAAMAANAVAVGVELRGGTGEHLAEAALGKVAAPVVVLAGDRSRPFFAAAAERIAKAVPGARKTVLAGASHMLQIERPADIVAAVDN